MKGVLKVPGVTRPRPSELEMLAWLSSALAVAKRLPESIQITVPFVYVHRCPPSLS